MGRMTPLIIIFLLILTSSLIMSQEGETTPEPEATVEVTPEITPEATPSVDEALCPALVEQALRITRQNCEDAENNEVCYGHLLLDAILREGIDPNTFDIPGQTVDVTEIENLSLSALDTNAGVWGVVLMQIQAALQQAEIKDSEVTYIVFGDATLENANQLLPITTLQRSNIRLEPSTSADIVLSVESDANLVASGRTEAGDWLRIRFRDADDVIQTGWIFAELVKSDVEITALPIIDPENPDTNQEDLVNYGPMQAFYFSSGIDDAPCAAAPNSGMLIQTPEGQASVSLWIDEVVVELTATAFVQADANGDITVNVLDGAARVTANGETRTAVEGTSVSVPLNDELGAADVPNAPEPIDENVLQSLPTILLDNPVDIPTPLNVTEGVPASGSWLFSWGVSSMACPDGTTVTFASQGKPGPLIASGDGSTLEWGGIQYPRISSGVYSASYIDGNGNLHQDTLTVSALDRISGVSVVDYATTVCTLEVPFSLSLVGN